MTPPVPRSVRNARSYLPLSTHCVNAGAGDHANGQTPPGVLRQARAREGPRRAREAALPQASFTQTCLTRVYSSIEYADMSLP